MSLDIPDVAPQSFDFDDPGTTQEQRLAAIRTRLTRRINSVSLPSRTIDELYSAHERCTRAAHALRTMVVRAPRVLSLMRGALRQAFGLDPYSLLFSEPLPPRPTQHRNSLMDRTLALFTDPYPPINLHHFTALSIKGDPGARLPFNAVQALERVGKLELVARVGGAVADYWQQLAQGRASTRQERAVELHKAVFADRAFLAQQLFMLSDAGYTLVKQLWDAPTVAARQLAGGDWATVHAGQVMWPHASAGSLAIPGALHIYRDSTTQVVYLPGLHREFHEFSSWQQMQAQLPERIKAWLLGDFWQYLPFNRADPATLPALQPSPTLSGDALAYSLHALLAQQWANEWAALLSINYAVDVPLDAELPSRSAARLLRFIEKSRHRVVGTLAWGPALDELLEWDRLRRQPEVTLASQCPDLPRGTRALHIRRYEHGLLALLDAKNPARETDAYQVFLRDQEQRQAKAQAVRQWTLDAGERLLQRAFWTERPDGTRNRSALVFAAQVQALRCEAQLMHQLGVIEQAHLDRLLEVLNTPLAAARQSSDTCVLRVSIGGSSPIRYTLTGLLVVTTTGAQGAPAQLQPVVLVVSGSQGGLAVFECLDGLSQSLRASLAGPDDSTLWRCVKRDERSAARMATSLKLEVDYTIAPHDVLRDDFKALIDTHRQLDKRLADNARLFSEISDPGLARRVLAQELFEHLQVPDNPLRNAALANVELLRLAARHAKTQPAWLATASAAVKKNHRHLQRRYLGSAMALEGRLWQVLPPLETFARQRLTAQLTADGFFPGVDIDQPLLDMPDDVGSQFCGWASTCAPGDRHIKKTVSPQRSTFSLLELALHNLDPQAPWTEWRLNRARYLQPAWQMRLTPRYLMKTLASLDIAGHYQQLIRQVFYPARSSTGLPRPLIDRAARQLARVQLFSATQQGLSLPAQQLFTRAMAPRAATGVPAPTLSFVRLRGHTLAHDRHITGLLVIVDKRSPLCLVYWPSAVHFPVLSEYADWQLARAALNRQGASPDNLRTLASLVAPGWEAEALAGYPGYRPAPAISVAPLVKIIPTRLFGHAVLGLYEQISRFVRSFNIKHRVAAAATEAIEVQIREQIDAEPMAWLDIVNTCHCDALAVLAHGRMLEIQRRVHARANTGAALAQYREQRLGEQWEATVRGLLSFVPVLGVGISLYEMLLAARRFHLSGRPEDAVDVAFITLMAFFDVLTSFVPTAKLARPGAALGRGAMRSALRQLHRRQAWMANTLATPQAAAHTLGVLERFKKPFSSEGALALRGAGEKGIYVKNGEQFLVDGEYGYPLYRRRDETGLRIKSPGDQAEGELVLYIREEREWLLGADAPPSPQPGPSSGLWQPFRAQRTTVWQAPSRVALDRAMRQTQVQPQSFQAWAVARELTLTDLLPARGIFQVTVAPPARNYRVLHYNGRYYRVLPEGGNLSFRDLVFITRDQPLAHAAAVDVRYWLEAGLFDQPIPATVSANGQWTFHRPLFSEPLHLALARAFPGMLASSRGFLIERLLELSDPHPRLTATHLLDLKATLDKWLAPNAVGQTDDMLKLLRPLDSTTRTTVYLGDAASTPGFERADFRLRQPLHRSLQLPTQTNLIERSQIMQKAVREVLEQQGFIVRALDKKPGAKATLDYSCTHPHSSNRYYVLTRWANTSSVKLHAAHAMQLTDEWFNRRSVLAHYAKAFEPLKKAMDEGRLVRIIAGIQWTTTEPPTLYFVRFGSLKPGAVPPHRQSQKRPHSPD